jgi:hypothetical protein
LDYHLQDIDYAQNFRQGDIIQRDIRENGRTKHEWGFVLNADCDIEQSKNFERISWMEILPAEYYLDIWWARFELQKDLSKRALSLCEELNALIRRVEPSLDMLEASSLISWLQQQAASEIAASIGCEKEETLRKLSALEQAARATGPCLEALVQLRQTFGTQRANVLKSAQDSLTASSGFPDTVFVPGLPGFMEQGFVMRLRGIFSIEQRHVLRSFPEWKISDEPAGFFRTGRFSDRMRYQVVQRMAFLFLRIGAPRDYDDYCGQMAGQILSEKGAV